MAKESKDIEVQADKVQAHRALPEHLRDGYNEIRKLSKDECLRLWSALTGKAVEILRQRAQLVFRFEQEGWDVKALGNGHAQYYLRIAYGQMLPELFIAVSNPYLLDRVCRLTIPEQERVVRNEKIPVLVDFNNDDRPMFKMYGLAEVRSADRNLVFYKNKINDKAEQIALVRSRKRDTPDPRAGVLVVDQRRGGATAKVGNVTLFFSRDKLAEALAALGRPDAD